MKQISRAAIIAVGSEMLTPSKIDTNSLFITEQLNLLGIQVAFKTIVGDDRGDLETAVRDALTRVEMREPLVAEGEPPSPYAAIVNFWIPDAEVFAKASAAHGQTLVQDKAHFTNSEQEVQSEVVFGEAGKPASAVRTGDKCLTVLYPHDPADRFDYEYYRDHHMTSLIKLFGQEAISRIEIRKSLSSADGRNPPLYA